jgi:hypothetical protein
MAAREESHAGMAAPSAFRLSRDVVFFPPTREEHGRLQCDRNIVRSSAEGRESHKLALNYAIYLTEYNKYITQFFSLFILCEVNPPANDGNLTVRSRHRLASWLPLTKSYRRRSASKAQALSVPA